MRRTRATPSRCTSGMCRAAPSASACRTWRRASCSTSNCPSARSRWSKGPRGRSFSWSAAPASRRSSRSWTTWPGAASAADLARLGRAPREGIYLRGAVAKWQRQWPAFRFVAALSEEAGDPADGAFAGRVDQALLAHFPDLAGHELYCCGSPPMVDAVRDMTVHRCGLAAADFHADVFVDGPAASTPAQAAAND
ncbi:MAG: hypothetical protein WKG52_08420 [Variovorax sp.]